MKKTSTEQIKHLIKESRESELSKKLVLESLWEHEILDLESFVAHSIQASKNSQARPLAEQYGQSMINVALLKTGLPDQLADLRRR